MALCVSDDSISIVWEFSRRPGSKAQCFRLPRQSASGSFWARAHVRWCTAAQQSSFRFLCHLQSSILSSPSCPELQLLYFRLSTI